MSIGTYKPNIFHRMGRALDAFKGVWIVVCALLLVACGGLPPTSSDGAVKAEWDVTVSSARVTRFHDEGSHVTCWLSSSGYGHAISCLPDAQVTRDK